MRNITITTRKNSLTKTLAVAVAVLGMGAMSVQPAQAAPAAPVASFASAPAGDNRPTPKPRPAPRPTQLADAPEQSRSCYDHAYEVYLTSGWYEAAAAYLNCNGNPNHPDNDDKPKP